MTDPIPAPAKMRTTRLALLHALPAILLISLMLWTFAGTSAAILALAIDLDLIGILLSVVLFLPPPCGPTGMSFGSPLPRSELPSSS